MKKCLMLLADGFEETEALAAHDIFTRSGEIETTLVSISDDLIVRSSMGVDFKAQVLLKDIDVIKFDLLYLPGGKKGVENLGANKLVNNAIEYFLRASKDIAAICAAPSLLLKYGVFDNAPFTCYPGFEGGKDTYMNEEYVLNNHIFTGRSAGFTVAFALAIVEKYFGEEASYQIRRSINGNLDC